VSIIGHICFGKYHNGIDRGMKKLEWHISKSCFCNGIFPKCESYNGIDPINPSLIGVEKSPTHCAKYPKTAKTFSTKRLKFFGV
jgi:hypothetical protein